jgi:Fe-S-cluster containining protein
LVYAWRVKVTERHKKFLNPEAAAAEMEKFKCVQCGNCCLNLYDAFCTTAEPEDLHRWENEGRWDILDWVSFLLEDDRTLADLWISPRTGEEVTRCPWLRKLPRKDKYICRIHDTKPIHCKKYPHSKKHALTTGCKGFVSNNPVVIG